MLCWEIGSASQKCCLTMPLLGTPCSPGCSAESRAAVVARAGHSHSALSTLTGSRGFTSLYTFRNKNQNSPYAKKPSDLLPHQYLLALPCYTMATSLLSQNYKGEEKNPHPQDSTTDIFKTRRLSFSSIWKQILPLEQQPYPYLGHGILF